VIYHEDFRQEFVIR
jgi:serine/threonine protein kinase